MFARLVTTTASFVQAANTQSSWYYGSSSVPGQRQADSNTDVQLGRSGAHSCDCVLVFHIEAGHCLQQCIPSFQLLLAFLLLLQASCCSSDLCFESFGTCLHTYRLLPSHFERISKASSVSKSASRCLKFARCLQEPNRRHTSLPFASGGIVAVLVDSVFVCDLRRNLIARLLVCSQAPALLLMTGTGPLVL